VENQCLITIHSVQAELTDLSNQIVRSKLNPTYYYITIVGIYALFYWVRLTTEKPILSLVVSDWNILGIDSNVAE